MFFTLSVRVYVDILVFISDIDFRYFVILMWYYCTIANNLNALAFSVYDSDGNGVLSPSEANLMLQQIYGKYYFNDDNVIILSNKMKELGRDGVTKLFFVEFCKRNPAVLEPAKNNIDLLIRHSLGAKKWQRLSEHRKRMTKDKFKNILDIIVMIQEKAGDDSDLFNVRHEVAHRAIKEKKRLKKKYSQEYLDKNKKKLNGLDTASDVMLIMDEDTDQSLNDSPGGSPSMKKRTKKSPSKSCLVVPTAT